VRRIWTHALPVHVGKRVRLAGWLHHRRELSRLTFLVLRDASGLAQIVLEGDAAVEAAAWLPETVLEVEGVAVASEQAPEGVEVHQSTFRVLAEAAEVPPLELRRPVLKEALPMQLDHAAVALRHPRRRDVFRISAASVAGYRAALDALGFVEIHTPKVVGGATEGGANVFTVDWFGRPAYLAQSPQLYKQVMVGVFERVYETGPVFRAEPHDTGRHLAEYRSLDAEVAFIDGIADVIEFARAAIAGMVDGVSEGAGTAVARLGIDVPEVPAEIPTVQFDEALCLAGAPEDEPDLAPEHERRLCEWALAEHGSDFVFVVGYPLAKRPFYTHPDPARPGASLGFDLLFRGLELVTGGQRLHRYEDYLAALSERSISAVGYEGYLEAFRFGMPPHGGFAIGLERWTARLVGAANVREATLFPRDRSRLSP
jgi:nondiscriminating aspartyl-tRNA synthetase